MMDFEQLFRMGQTALEVSKRFVDAYQGAKIALSTQEMDRLQPLLNEIHAKNMELSKSIDEAAAEAEKR